MKKRLAIILIFGTLIAAGFALRFGVLSMADEMHGHGTDIACLSHCLMAASSDANVATVTTAGTFIFVAFVAWFVSVPLSLLESKPGRILVNLDPERRFLIARLD
ncbi:hypothetical protein A2348_01655 [Candidatus Uhrbacteria bacterium RIFOXYB12_FULL_58_10]|uniref:Uncharacterized protein n=1 Tax=Candidatus Uhrbacteria bacterium RIFOXYB2_FULL_57_15 TaxID=1802422 RepID=A0A1F7W9U1_9BACT|nr:MAG: hypothetical protein A2348_01655 [Candidatus Uhrbacteria bacterium RIFOXYB12_FULL_58_10]OGL99560.1 MAG: hypothetical protein A2304_05505 [Candidatus Uhrbacteria bacterium RIFOXYB2_FULL_57_15]OGL99835.1 MAG: hypothetical protein A2501_05400 [Candidatus Uhrbacteria bacterium RIFOXYC12_FULL_57_11]